MGNGEKKEYDIQDFIVGMFVIIVISAMLIGAVYAGWNKIASIRTEAANWQTYKQDNECVAYQVEQDKTTYYCHVSGIAVVRNEKPNWETIQGE